MPKKRNKYIVWSEDEDSGGSYVDIVMASTVGNARAIVKKVRGDPECDADLLSDYIAHLTKQLNLPDEQVDSAWQDVARAYCVEDA